LLVGGAIVAVIVVLALLGPSIAPYPFDQFQLSQRMKPPSAEHWLGTDEFGRDVLSRILAGGGSSLAMGFGASAISLAIGVPLGLFAAWRRGWVEEGVMRGVDLLISIPPILLGSALSFLGLGAQPPASEWGLMIAESRPFIAEAPWIGLAPGVALCILLVSVNLVGEGLREALDPRLLRRGH
jgi:ABC-type dipeptide/oligopeptide/nickel transport system permease subunit